MVLAEVEAIEPHLQDALHALGIEVEDPAGWPDSHSVQVEGVLGEIAALRADLEKPGIKDVFAGIGYIFGLFGAAAFVAARRKE
jgi:hypothetical protein